MVSAGAVRTKLGSHVLYKPALKRLTHLPLDKMAAISQTYYKSIFVNEKFCVFILISVKFVPKGTVKNK